MVWVRGVTGCVVTGEVGVIFKIPDSFRLMKALDSCLCSLILSSYLVREKHEKRADF